jgi:hypothetical protein
VRLGQVQQVHEFVDVALAAGEGIEDFPAAGLSHRVERICRCCCPCHEHIIYPYRYVMLGLLLLRSPNWAALSLVVALKTTLSA